ncbi:bifunctional adenosylcobinamide kinase/adenosylcobinamide-phosphate guanylyltransferase [Microvirga sp. 17 mud 1-3]|uniref:bifunctional adenosylcobinamide kinase/adenosylcobinamide-phosphate guanylyltransferase n=1 Tax=Microvirga sp. 17 mud 1-3 TaxID=2082949 RepID=UPI000D6C5817|nr:bifunctional adenosylcobinamide kinase/adenosylcobinamide-phosphate guanylyltransferase [Microvirga sp. 17 mud 1-3]AWM88254.1 bifunctional adenosylcobinamide kinase/adenosylcobinamide-phosphate guanylyltransferase [Microvirga sp. 17 mud 1-3]
MTIHRRALVLGGARSGKSRTAQAIAEKTAGERLFVATAQPFDDEMRERIRRHRDERRDGWRTCEAPLELAQAIREGTGPGRVVLVDCLTLWLSNVLLAGRDVEDETERLAGAVRDAGGPVVLVSNEVGQGIVPETPLGRRFRDAQGRLNQRMAETCDAVILVAAGCPLLLKPAPSLDLTLA